MKGIKLHAVWWLEWQSGLYPSPYLLESPPSPPENLKKKKQKVQKAVSEAPSRGAASSCGAVSAAGLSRSGTEEVPYVEQLEAPQGEGALNEGSEGAPGGMSTPW